MSSIGSMSSSSMLSTTASPVKRVRDHKMERSFSKEDSLEKRISVIALDTIQLLSARMQKKAEDCLTYPSVINTGAFYPNTYYELLEKMLEHPPITDKAKEVIAKRLQVYTKKDHFFHGIAPRKFFKPVPSKNSPSGFEPNVYVLKDNTVRPSQALKAILEDECLIFIGCGEAVQIAYYKALLDLLGEEKFDYFFAADGPIPFLLGMQHPKNPLLLFIHNLKEGEPLTEGCFVYKSNTTLYGIKHMNGDCVGFNLLYSGKRYFGLSSLNPKGWTEQELDQSFINAYNQEPFGSKGLTKKLSKKIESTYKKERLEKFESMRTHTISSEEYQKTDGGKIYGANTLNPDLVKGLIKFDKELGRTFLENCNAK